MDVCPENIITAGPLPVKDYLLPSRILGTFWRHRDLVRQMTWRNVLVRYRGSSLGIAWSFLIPLINYYEIQASISQENDRYCHVQEMLHWKDEAAFFQVMMATQEYSFGGVCDLRMRAHEWD